MPAFEIRNGEIEVDKEITAIDRFAIETLRIIGKYARYVIIGGYVAIFFGSSRAVEDIDIFIEDPGFPKFVKLYTELKRKGYELTIGDAKALYYDCLKCNLSIRVWEKGFPLLNLELKTAESPSQKLAIAERIRVRMRDTILYFAPIEPVK